MKKNLPVNIFLGLYLVLVLKLGAGHVTLRMLGNVIVMPSVCMAGFMF